MLRPFHQINNQLSFNSFLQFVIDHFTVACLVACPLNESEAGDDLFLIETSPLVNDAILILISSNLHKSREVSIKTRSTPDSFSFKGQATKHTVVKWSI